MIAHMLARSIRQIIAGLLPSVDFGVQYNFRNKEMINEVNEAFAVLTGTYNVANGKLTTAADNSSYASMPVMMFAPNEDFCLQIRTTFVATSSNNNIVGVWTQGSETASCSWLLYRYGSGAGNLQDRISFYLNAPGAGILLNATSATPANKEVEIEVSRTNGIVYLFIDGVVQASAPYTGGSGNQTTATPRMRTDVLGATPLAGYYNGGLKSAFRIVRGKGGNTTNYTKGYTLPDIVPAAYDSTTLSNLVANISLRRDNSINEVNGRNVMHTENTVQSARIQQKYSTTAMSITRIEPFWQADFTIEMMVNITAVSSNQGILLGEWHRGDIAHENNRWEISVTSGNSINFAIAGSTQPSPNNYPVNLSSTDLLVRGQDTHIVIERVAGVVTMYLNGKAQGSVTYAGAIRGNAPYFVRTNSTSQWHSYQGELWNIRIAKTSLYKGKIKTSYALPVAKPVRQTYTAAEAKDIVVQYDFNDATDEKTRNVVTLNGSTVSDSAMVLNNSLFTAASNAAQYFIPTEVDFLAKDFTIEAQLTVHSLSSSSSTNSYPLFGQWFTQTNDSWVVYIDQNSREIGFQISKDGTSSTNGILYAGSGIILELGKQTHIVVECIGRVARMYVNGVRSNTTWNLPATIATSTIGVTNLYEGDKTRFTSATLYKFRIARRAMYNGNITSPEWPRIARKNKRVTMQMGTATPSINGSTATLTGFAQNLMYQAPQASMGSISDTLFRTLDGKVKRLVGLFHQVHTPPTPYLVMFEKDTDITPTDDMPLFSRILQLNGVAYDLTALASSPANEGFGATGRAWQVGNSMGGLLYNGRMQSFEFLPPYLVGQATVPVASQGGTVDFTGYMRNLKEVTNGGTISEDLVIDASNPRSCKLYKIRGIWTQSNNYLCIGLETLMTAAYSVIEAQYPNIADIPRFGATLFAGDNLPGKTFASATTINQGDYMQYYWSITAAQVTALNTNMPFYFG